MKIEGKRILVTGGAGFIGSHIVESLVAQNAEVTVFDNFSSGKYENLERVKDKVEIIEGDVLDYSSLLEAVRGKDIVSHHAAQLEIFRCIDNPVMDLKVNTIGTLNVLKACIEVGVRKLINASSACVYGQAETIPQSEDHPKNPNWPYGVSKLAAEKYCEIYRNIYFIPIVSLRYGIVYGEREWFGRVLTIFIKRALERKPLVIFGDGKQVRDFIHIEDVVRMHNECIKNEKAVGIYNVGTGKGVTINELAQKVIDVLGSKLEVIHEEVKEGEFSRLVEGRRRIPMELKQMVLDIRKAKRELGFSPKISLKEGIRREMDWASNNPNAWNIQGIIRI